LEPLTGEGKLNPNEFGRPLLSGRENGNKGPAGESCSSKPHNAGIEGGEGGGS